MATSYEHIRKLEGKEPYIVRGGRNIKEQTRFLQKSEMMKGIPLGACLDSCRYGTMTTTLYEMSVNAMVKFINNWMEQNPDNFQDIFHEKPLNQVYKNIELPHFNYDKCPRNKEHQETVEDLSGRIRCANIDLLKFDSSLIDSYLKFDNQAQMKRIEYFEKDVVNLPTKQDLVVTNVCYAILSDKESVLPLETILDRMNICGDRFPGRKDVTEFPCDGWDLAAYTQLWYEQIPGLEMPSLFNK